MKFSCEILTKYVSGYVNRLDFIITYAYQDIGVTQKPHDHLFTKFEPSNTGMALKYEKFTGFLQCIYQIRFWLRKLFRFRHSLCTSRYWHGTQAP